MNFFRAGLLAASLAAFLSAAGCGGGCGEEPKEKTSPPASSGGGGGGSSSGGGGGVAVGERTMAAAERGAAQAAKPAEGQAKAGPGVPAKEPVKAEVPAPKPKIEDVTLADFKPKVLEGPGLVLLLTYAPESRPCRQAVLALEGLLPELPPSAKIYRLEMHAPGHPELLPKGMTAFPIPSFALYEGGKVLATKQGRPFAPRGGEKEEAYLLRLRDWARAALAKKSF